LSYWLQYFRFFYLPFPVPHYLILFPLLYSGVFASHRQSSAFVSVVQYITGKYRLPMFSVPWINVLALVVLLSACQSAKERERPPNLVLIMADDLGFETLGCYGGQSYATPHLDRLAAGGMLFEHCYSTPLCTPSRVQIMTGRYNHHNYLAFGMLSRGEATFAHLLQEAGYATCVVGKWQLYGNAHQRELFDTVGTRPERAGFDEYCLWQIEERGLRFKNPYLETSRRPLQTYEGAYGPDLYTDYALDFIERHRDTTFFLYYPMALVHDPFQPTPETAGFAAFDPAVNLNDTTYFPDMMRYMDRLIGRIEDKLAALGLQENTLLLFVGDNGTDRDVVSSWRGQRIQGNKGYPTEYGTHVPLIASWPGRIAAGSRNPQLVDFTDFLPTLLEAAGATPPTTLQLDGLSFYPQMMNAADAPAREWVFCDYAPRWGRFEPARYVHDKRWKLYEDGRFFDLQNDLMEERPLSREEAPQEGREAWEAFEGVLTKMR